MCLTHTSSLTSSLWKLCPLYYIMTLFFAAVIITSATGDRRLTINRSMGRNKLLSQTVVFQVWAGRPNAPGQCKIQYRVQKTSLTAYATIYKAFTLNMERCPGFTWHFTWFLTQRGKSLKVSFNMWRTSWVVKFRILFSINKRFLLVHCDRCARPRKMTSYHLRGEEVKAVKMRRPPRQSEPAAFLRLDNSAGVHSVAACCIQLYQHVFCHC